VTVPGTVQDGLRILSGLLREGGVARPEREARLLLAHAMSVAPDRITLQAGEALAANMLADARSLTGRRTAGEPVSHILGHREFWGRRFGVDSRVLDPRPETECLIATALEDPYSEVLDLGMGSGCILLTLLAEAPTATGIGVDVSQDALAVARCNAAALGVSDRVVLTQSDWFSAVAGRYDLIVSNPPYIGADEMAGLQPELRLHEPRVALTDGGDGLSAYRAIAAGLRSHLASDGRCLVEVGAGQAEAVASLFRAAGLAVEAPRTDMDSRPRVIIARRA